MKPQLPKVALIATLAFIGIGFTGTQRANAADPNCPPDAPEDYFTCGDETVSAEEAALTPCSEPTSVDNDFTTGCFDTSGDCIPDTPYAVQIVNVDCTRINGEAQSCTAVRYTPTEGECAPPPPPPTQT